MKFYGRREELNELAQIRRLAANGARLTVVTGRRRVGKTEFRREIAETLHKPVSEIVRHANDRNYYIFTLTEDYRKEYAEE